MDRCGSLWIVVDHCGIVVGSLWIVVGRCRSLWIVVDHCGSFRVLVTAAKSSRTSLKRQSKANSLSSKSSNIDRTVDQGTNDSDS